MRDNNMDDDLHIAPIHELIRYLCLFRRWFVASQGYVRHQDTAGVILAAWIADALHNVPTMLWRYDPKADWNGPAQLAAWMKSFPKVVRKQGAPARIAADCDAIFSPAGAWAELHLDKDLSDLDLAPAEKMAAYLDIFRDACLYIRWRHGPYPWKETSEHWQAHEAET